MAEIDVHVHVNDNLDVIKAIMRMAEDIDRYFRQKVGDCYVFTVIQEPERNGESIVVNKLYPELNDVFVKRLIYSSSNTTFGSWFVYLEKYEDWKARQKHSHGDG